MPCSRFISERRKSPTPVSLKRCSNGTQQKYIRNNDEKTIGTTYSQFPLLLLLTGTLWNTDADLGFCCCMLLVFLYIQYIFPFSPLKRNSHTVYLIKTIYIYIYLNETEKLKNILHVFLSLFLLINFDNIRNQIIFFFT